MTRLTIFGFLFITILLFGCKKTSDPTLAEALAIQDEAIHMGMDLNKEIGEMMSSDPTVENLSALGKIKTDLMMWKKQMIPVPGMKHDHDHEGHDHKDKTKDTTAAKGNDHSSHDHEGHDHEGHDHEVHGRLLSSNEEIAATLTPEEIKLIQTDWKNELLKIKAELDTYKSTRTK
jgi:ABC-type Zn2+ transport system substrate-binding protein/surface adhesin